MQERCVITYLLGNETKDSTTETKLPKSKTSFEMSRELHSSKTVPCRKSFMPQGHRSSSSQQWCFFVQELGFALELFQDYNSISRPMKFLQTPPLSVPSHCTPTNHYFKSPVSADAHEKGQRSKDWPGSSKPCTAAPWLQAHFRDPNTADQTKDKSPVPWFLPQLKHTPRRALTQTRLQRCLGCNFIYMNIAMAEAWRGTVTCQTLAGLATRKSIALPRRRYFVLVVADSKPALNRCQPGSLSAFAD